MLFADTNKDTQSTAAKIKRNPTRPWRHRKISSSIDDTNTQSQTQKQQKQKTSRVIVTPGGPGTELCGCGCVFSTKKNSKS